jgi:peptide/nickel transport system permease protein
LTWIVFSRAADAGTSENETGNNAKLIMGRYLLSRLMQSVALLSVISLVTYTLVLLAPGGPSILLDPLMTRDQREQMKHLMGLDQPVYLQYSRWIKSVFQGDLGRSFSLGRPVRDIIVKQLPNTALLSGTALILTILIAIPLGIYSAVHRNSLADQLVTLAVFFGLSVPVFWLGILLIVLFSLSLRWLPAGGMVTIGAPFSLGDLLQHMAMPVIVLASSNLAVLTRFTRSSMISVLQEDYVRTARAKGLVERLVLYRHAFKNAMIPSLTVLGLLLPRLVGGSAITETVFVWPGMGLLAVQAAYERDYPMIMGIALIVSLVVVISNLGVDLLYAYFDPRVRYE